MERSRPGLTQPLVVRLVRACAGCIGALARCAGVRCAGSAAQHLQVRRELSGQLAFHDSGGSVAGSVVRSNANQVVRLRCQHESLGVESLCELHLVIVYGLTVLSPARNYERPSPGLQRDEDASNASVHDDDSGFGHKPPQLRECQEVDALSALWTHARGTVLDHQELVLC